MIEFGPGERVLIEDGTDLLTGEVLETVGIMLCPECEGRGPLYLVALDDGRCMITLTRDLWPEHPRPLPGDPADVEDGSHEWAHGMGVHS